VPCLCHTTEEKARKNLRVVEKCPDVTVAVVQYTLTHKQYAEQHNETDTQNGTYITIRILKLIKEHVT
jgi:hypothetical protein